MKKTFVTKIDENDNYSVNFGDNEIVAAVNVNGYVKAKHMTHKGKPCLSKIYDFRIEFTGLSTPKFVYLLNDNKWLEEDKLENATEEDLKDYVTIKEANEYWRGF